MQDATLANHNADYHHFDTGENGHDFPYGFHFLWMEVSWTQQGSFNFDSSDTLIKTKWEIQRNNA